MKIRHTVIFTFYNSTSKEQKEEVIKWLNEMGEFLQQELGVINWVVAKHISETFKEKRSDLLQDGIFPSLDALQQHSNSEVHKRVIELTKKVCDWMTIDTIVPEN